MRLRRDCVETVSVSATVLATVPAILRTVLITRPTLSHNIP